MASDRTAKLAKREQDRIARERAEVNSKCTFKPRTNDAYVTRKNGVVNWSRVDEARGRVPLQERLVHEADTRVTTRESLKRQLERLKCPVFHLSPASIRGRMLYSMRTHINRFMNALKIYKRRGERDYKSSVCSMSKTIRFNVPTKNQFAKPTVGRVSSIS